MAVKMNNVIHPILSDEATLSLDFGNTYSNGSFHKGIDVYSSQKRECDVIAAFAGTVTGFANNISGYVESTTSTASMGNYVVIKTNDGYINRYQHLKYQSVKVKKGQVVKAGDIIGKIGNTGHSNGRHLHFDVSKSGNVLGGRYISSQGKTYFDPKEFICAANDKYIVTANVLNVRYSASSSSKKVGTLNKGSVVTVSQKQNNFGKIGENKWVSLEYLKKG